MANQAKVQAVAELAERIKRAQSIVMTSVPLQTWYGGNFK